MAYCLLPLPLHFFLAESQKGTKLESLALLTVMLQTSRHKNGGYSPLHGSRKLHLEKTSFKFESTEILSIPSGEERRLLGGPKKYSCSIKREMHNKRGFFKNEICLHCQ